MLRKAPAQSTLTVHPNERTAVATVESVWEYPRPPRLEASTSHLRVVHEGVCVAETHRSLRVLETSHPPVFYLPPEDVRLDLLRPSASRQTFCEWKGVARYWTLEMPESHNHSSVAVPDVGWSYPQPTSQFAPLRDHIAFYPGKVDECWVDGERVRAQAGDFYGGWITSQVRGPFKGGPGTRGW